MVQYAATPSSEYDTIVVGAGPAGIICALEASKRGPVLIAEASRLPRDKSCGGMLNEWSQTFLAPLGGIPPEVVLDPAHVHFRFHDWDRDIHKPTQLRFLNVDRRGFDEWLLSNLPENVDVIGQAHAVDFEQDDDSVRVKIRSADGERIVTARTLVGADGARSTVRRSLAVGSVATYVTLQDYCELSGPLEPYFDCVYIRDVGDCFGYGYVVPKGRTAIVGSVYYPKTKKPHEKQDMLLDLLRKRLPLGPSVKREACAALSVREAEDIVCGTGRVLLAGEAGGFMSPTSGEGISYAMNTGLLAGTAIAESDPNDPDAALAAYSRATADIRANIARKLKWLPFMESSWGKYLAGFVPTALVSRVTRGL